MSLRIIIAAVAAIQTIIPLESSAQDGDWTSLSPSPIARTEAPSVVYDGKLFVFAGFAPDLIITGATEVYDPVADSWSSLSPMPRPVTHAGAALVDDSVWIVGGFEGDHPGRTVDLVQIYDLPSDSWSTGPSLPARRASGTLALLGRKLHYIGGLRPNRDSDVHDHYVLDLDNAFAGWSVAAPLPVPRNHLSSVAYGGRIYVIGGQTGHDSGRTFSKLVHVYDPSSDSWSRARNLPSARSHFESSTFVHNGRIVIAGGVGAGSENDPATHDVSEYDPVANVWSEPFTLPDKLLAPVAKVIDEKLIVSHGSLGQARYAQSGAWSRPLRATMIDTLGIWPAVVETTLREADAEILSVLLWTRDGRVSYSLDTSSDADWLTVINEGSGVASPSGAELAVHIDASALQSGTYEGSLTVTAPGFSSVTLPVVLRVSDRLRDAFVETDGIIVMDAENYHRNRACTSHQWSETTLYESFGSAMQASPSVGAKIEFDYDVASPELRYHVAFSESGTYYVWIRAWGSDGDADSWHVGIDGLGSPTAEAMTLTKRGRWPPASMWTNETMAGERASLNVTAPGEHLVSVWMREDGVMLDRILLTNDADYVPAGSGPDESMRAVLNPDSSTSTTGNEPLSDIPIAYRLEANYPNPFNPTTTIGYALPRPEYVRIVVYDVLGHRVATLVDGPQAAGTHEVSLNASDLPSGTYLYELTAGPFRSVQNMILIK